MLPAIGIGTSRRYEVEPTPDTVAPLKEAVQTLRARSAASVIDTAPSYGTAEDVLGLILPEPGLRAEGLPRQQGRHHRPRGDPRGVRAVAERG